MPTHLVSGNFPSVLLRLLGLLALITISRLLYAGLRGGGQARSFPYRLRDGLLTPAELMFHKRLVEVIRNDFIICPKVRLADLFVVTNGDVGSLNRITSKHVDFVICEPRTMAPLMGIELDDSSHRARKRSERDEFVEGVFTAARLPLLRLPVRHDYNPKELRGLVESGLQSGAAVAPVPQAACGESRETPECPECGHPMVLRTAQRGAKRGNLFYGCANYPECRQTVSV